MNIFKRLKISKKHRETNIISLLENYDFYHSTTLLGYLQHHVTSKFSDAILEQVYFNETQSDDRILPTIKKLINYCDFNKNEDIWGAFITPSHKLLFSSMLEDDRQALSILNNMFDNALSGGIELSGEQINSLIKKDKTYKEFLKLFHMDALVSLAEYLGVIHVENREQSRCGETIYMSPDDLWDAIEKKIEIKITLPTFKGGLFAIKTKRGYFTNRDCIYLYIAIRIREMIKNKDEPICEIGGGAGYLAYYCDLLGLKNITIIDLPSVRIGSTYFLMKNMPNAKFVFDHDSDIYRKENSIKLLSPEKFYKSPPKHYSIVLNCDSMPEMNFNIAKNYLESVKQKTDIFYSINQEAAGQMWSLPSRQNIIPDLIKDIEGFKRLSRNLFWLRKGYIEETYKCQS